MTAYTEKCSRSIAADSAGVLDTLALIFRQWMKNQRLRQALARERRQLAALTDDILKDIGVSRVQAETEARRDDIPAQRLFG